MGGLINIGFGNVVNTAMVLTVVRPEAAPVKRLVQNAKDAGTCYDATCGRKCKAVIVAQNGSLVLSALLPETIANRFNERVGNGIEG